MIFPSLRCRCGIVALWTSFRRRSGHRRFLARWYGPPQRPGEVPIAAHRLPVPLQAWYEAVSGYSSPVPAHNTLLGPDQAYERDGKLVFWRENQEVYEWAVDLHDEDPFVYERATVEAEPWHPTGVRLSAFLVSVAVFEAVLGAQHSHHVADLTDAERDHLLAGLRPLPMPGPTHGAQLYAGPGVLAFVTPMAGGGSSTTWSVYLAARSAEHLGEIRPATTSGHAPGLGVPATSAQDAG